MSRVPFISVDARVIDVESGAVQAMRCNRHHGPQVFLGYWAMRNDRDGILNDRRETVSANGDWDIEMRTDISSYGSAEPHDQRFRYKICPRARSRDVIILNTEVLSSASSIRIAVKLSSVVVRRRHIAS